MLLGTVSAGGEGFAKVLAALSVKASAEDAPANGQCGDDLYWNFDAGNCTLTISGTGDMYDYGGEIPSDSSYWYGLKSQYLENPAPWDDFRTQIRKIDIQPGCTSVGNFAFYRCWYVRAIAFPEGVTTIGNYIFDNSFYNIQSVFLPQTLTSIGEKFIGFGRDNYNIKHVSFVGYAGNENQYHSITGVGYNYSFGGHVYYSSRDILNSDCFSSTYYYNAKCIDDYMLSVNEDTKTAEIIAYMGYGEHVDIPSQISEYTITSIGPRSFYNCDFIKSVTIPDTVTSIKAAAFIFSGIENFCISENVSKIGDAAFFSMKGNYVVIDNEYNPYYDDYYIGYPYYEPNLDENELQENSIGEPLDVCVLKSITVDTQNPYFSSDENGALYNKDKTVLFQYPLGAERDYFIIPTSVTSIWNYALYPSNYSDLERIYIPKTVSLLTNEMFGAGLIIDYEGTQEQWDNLIINSYPTYPNAPSDDYSSDYYEYRELENDLIQYVENYNFNYEGWHYQYGSNTIDWMNNVTINFNVRDAVRDGMDILSFSSYDTVVRRSDYIHFVVTTTDNIEKLKVVNMIEGAEFKSYILNKSLAYGYWLNGDGTATWEFDYTACYAYIQEMSEQNSFEIMYYNPDRGWVGGEVDPVNITVNKYDTSIEVHWVNGEQVEPFSVLSVEADSAKKLAFGRISVLTTSDVSKIRITVDGKTTTYAQGSSNVFYFDYGDGMAVWVIQYRYKKAGEKQITVEARNYSWGNCNSLSTETTVYNTQAELDATWRQ